VHSFPHVEHGFPIPNSLGTTDEHSAGITMPTSTTAASRVPHAGGGFEEQEAAVASHAANARPTALVGEMRMRED
jgi:hypothetical protein